jgi:hypothetical protein
LPKEKGGLHGDNPDPFSGRCLFFPSGENQKYCEKSTTILNLFLLSPHSKDEGISEIS